MISFVKRKLIVLVYKMYVRIGLLFGFRCYNMYVSWFTDKEFIRVQSRFSKSLKKPIHERRFTLYYLAKSIRNISGDIAECGVYKGEGSYYIIKANQKTGKSFYLFDSFEGLSDPDKNDVPTKERAFRWKKNDLLVSEKYVQKNLKRFPNVYCLKGWIPERYDEVSNKKFSFVHIDVDLYKPTLDSLKFFYPKVNRGGLIVCDDYGFDTCPGARKAMDQFFKNKPESVIYLTTGQGVVVRA